MRIDVKKTDDRGATAIEYALLIAGVAMALIVAVMVLGGNVAQAITGAAGALSGQGAGTAADGTPEGGAAEEGAAEEAPAEEGGAEEGGAEETPAALAPYAGPTPSSSYSQNLGNRGTYTLPSIPGVSYALAGCSNEEEDGCEKASFTGSALQVDSKWSSKHRAATITVSWSVPATDTTEAGSGTFTVTLR